MRNPIGQAGVILAAILLVIVIFAPRPAPPATPTQLPSPSPTPQLLDVSQQYSDVEGTELRTGLLSVVVNAQDQNTNLKVGVNSEEGIVFSGGALAKDVEMMPFESRQLLFPYQANQRVSLSGEYITVITVLEGNSVVPKGNSVTEKRVKNFVSVQGPNDVRLLSSQADFDAILKGGYRLQNTGYTALVALASGEEPTSGTLFIKIPSGKDGYSPEVTISVKGGIRFQEAAQVHADSSGLTAAAHLQPMLVPGSRLLRFPFTLDPNSTAGTYAFFMHVRTEETGDVTDYFPIALKVLSSTVKQNESWLATQEIPLAPSRTTAPTSLPTR